MLAELGLFALVLSAVVALVQAIVPLGGFFLNSNAWLHLAVPAARCQFVLIAIAFAVLTCAFINYDFSLAYVAENSNRQLPLQYRIAAVWGGHSGSLLLWSMILAGWGAAVAAVKLPTPTKSLVLAVLALIGLGFLLFMLLTSNPFDRLLPAPADGLDLNPLLQDIGLVVHPPMLYLGYVGFAVAFAFAMAALIEGRLDATWARCARPWVHCAWAFLTVGIALGSWWAYYELGWGGWWFWDPVENASFMPWLAGTALLHSLAATQRGAFKSWTVLLAVVAFSLSLLGTFLVRSGVLTSVHAFAADPARGLFILIFLAAVCGGAFALYAWRAPMLASVARFSLASREMVILINNILLGSLCFAVLLGTLYPLILDALSGAKISVGAPYFDFLFIALGVPLLLCMGLGVYLRWREDNLKKLLKKIIKPVLLSVAIGFALALTAAEFSFAAGVGLSLGCWVIITALMSVAKLHKRRWFVKIPRALVGMCVAHIGVGVFILGVVFVSAYSIEKEFAMRAGESAVVGGYEFKFEGITTQQGVNYQALRGAFEVHRVSENSKQAFNLYPEKRTYKSQQNAMTEAAIDAGIGRDVFVALGEPLDESGKLWSVRIHYKPMVRWIWGGALLMALGAGVAVGARRKNKIVM